MMMPAGNQHFVDVHGRQCHCLLKAQMVIICILGLTACLLPGKMGLYASGDVASETSNTAISDHVHCQIHCCCVLVVVM